MADLKSVVLGVSLLGLIGCGGGEERTFSKQDAGAGATGAVSGSGGSATGGASGSGGATGGASGSAGTGGATGGTAGSSGAAGSGGAAGSDAGAACDTTSNVCAPDAVAGWTGPVAFRKGAGAPPICPGNYGTKVADGNIGLVPGASSCKCSCDPAAGISCTGTAKLYDVGELIISCIGTPAGNPVWSGTSSTCSHPTSNTSGKVLLVPPTPGSMGTCTAKNAHILPPPSWTEETRLCTGGTPAAGTCGSGKSCLPQPSAPYELCVYRPGDMACPAGYSKKSLVYEKFTDSRSCSACSCGNATSTCGGTMLSASACSGFPLLHTSVSGCAVPAGGIDISTSHWASYSPKPTGTCTESASALTGTVTPSGEATVCCM